MEREWAGELEQWLQDRYVKLCETLGERVPLSGLRVSPGLGVEEAKYFLLGLEAGLFQPDELGSIQSDLLSAPETENARQTTCQMFWHDPPPPRLFRERICQLSTASSLILKSGWLRSHIRLDPAFQDDRDVSYGIDILVEAPTGEPLICVEVKRSVAELQKLITDLGMCCRRGPHAKDDCGFPQNHPKYEFCALHKPTYFWAVAPDADVCLGMKYRGGAIELEQLTSLPPRSLIESP
jgi:hypothetical protein